jgi:hypothetical protein
MSDRPFVSLFKKIHEPLIGSYSVQYTGNLVNGCGSINMEVNSVVTFGVYNKVDRGIRLIKSFRDFNYIIRHFKELKRLEVTSRILEELE